MPKKTLPTRKEPVHVRKRAGLHHTRNRRYLKSYWPYIPITIIIVAGLFLGNYRPHTKNGVLAYATAVNITTLLQSTNQQRNQNNQTSLTLNKELTAAAQAKANDMAARNYWSHNTPDGKEPWTFIQASGYRYQKAGENLAYGFNSSEDTIIGWMNSPTHRANLLDAEYTDVGFGFANAKDFNKAGPETIVVAMYATPQSNSTTTPANDSDQPSGAVTSLTPLTNEPKALGVARIQTITKGQLPWATLAIGILGGAAIAVMLLKHGLAVKKLLAEGEEFVIHHPWIDITLVGLLMLGYILSQHAGIIK